MRSPTDGGCSQQTLFALRKWSLLAGVTVAVPTDCLGFSDQQRRRVRGLRSIDSNRNLYPDTFCVKNSDTWIVNAVCNKDPMALLTRHPGFDARSE